MPAKARRKQVINELKLRQWVDTRKNVLFVGKHGVGKTSIVKEAWEKAGLHYRMYSCATLDPWVDFIGVPEKTVDENGNIYLGLVRPKEWEDDQIEAIFLDEFNRSHKKIRNACMELIQFKSINGRVFPNLKIVWAAINPEDEDGTYDVDRIDPAQEDRFHLHINVEYEPNREFFTKEFGSDIAGQAMKWWSLQGEKIQNLISPRRLEYAIRHHLDMGDLWDVLPHECGADQLKQMLGQTPIIKEWRKILDKQDKTAATDFLSDEDNYSQIIEDIISKKKQWNFAFSCMPDEKLSKIFSEHEMILNYCIQNLMSDEKIFKVMNDIVESNINPGTSIRIKKEIEKMKYPNIINNIYGGVVNPNKAKNVEMTTSEGSLTKIIDVVNGSSMEITSNRVRGYEQIRSVMPKNLTPETAIKTLELLERIVSHTQSKIIERNFTDFIGVVNKCFDTLKNENKIPEKIDTKFAKLLSYVSTKPDFYFSSGA